MMNEPVGLTGLRVFVAEDEAFCAIELEQLLNELKCDVVGVVNSVDKIHPSLIDADFALLDVNLRGENSYEKATELQDKGLQLAFVTGYPELPDRPAQLRDVPMLGKPFNKRDLAKVLTRLRARARGD